MIFRLLILFQFISVFGGATAPMQDKINAWIEIEGELSSLLVRAKIENTSQKNVFLNYELEMHSRSRIKNKKTLQKGKILVLKGTIIELSESRMNASSTEEICVLIKVLKDDELVAIDSVVFHAAK
ncbi:hypothetical protein ACXR6G_16915 [Ancylomarina sp. YFZ004]